MIWLRHCKKRLRLMPLWIRIASVALLGLALSWVTYEIVFYLNPVEPRATTSWVVAFAIGVLRQHHLHRKISFPENRLRYRISLRRDVLANSLIAAFVAGLNWLLTSSLGLHHRVAWAACTLSAASLTYGSLRLFTFRRQEHQR